MTAPATPREPYATLAQQEGAARLGMWAFLASEALLFAALFALFAGARAEHPATFEEGARHMALGLGTVNTFVLLTSSLVVALALPPLGRGRRRLAIALLLGAIAMGAAFLVIKGVEYARHFREGIYPGGSGAFFSEPPEHGLRLFFTLYYLMTGLHALHVTGGMAALAWAAWRAHRGAIGPGREHPLEFVGLYWHLVDVVWIFLWPLFYLARGG